MKFCQSFCSAAHNPNRKRDSLRACEDNTIFAHFSARRKQSLAHNMTQTAQMRVNSAFEAKLWRSFNESPCQSTAINKMRKLSRRCVFLFPAVLRLMRRWIDQHRRAFYSIALRTIENWLCSLMVLLFACCTQEHRMELINGGIYFENNMCQ